jgi:hypothetical protein
LNSALDRLRSAFASAFLFVLSLTSDCDIESLIRVSEKQGQDHIKLATSEWRTASSMLPAAVRRLRLMAEYPISRYWTDARIQRIYGGTNEIMKEIIARSLVGRSSKLARLLLFATANLRPRRTPCLPAASCFPDFCSHCWHRPRRRSCRRKS